MWTPLQPFADGSTRTRRDHAKYLGLIRAVTFLHQHQRPRRSVTVDGIEVAYVETTVSDIEVANRIAHEVLGRSLDELPPQTRRLLQLVHGYVGGHGSVRFSRRELREALGWGDTQLKVHLARLVDLEYVIVERGERGGFLYELAWDGREGVDGARFVTGLRDPATLTAPAGYHDHRSGSAGVQSGSGRSPVGPRSATSQTGHPGRSGLVNGHNPGVVERDGRQHIVAGINDVRVVVAAG